MQYLILQNGCIGGPYTRDAMFGLFNDGLMTPATQWRRIDAKDWRPITEFNFSEDPNLFENPFGASRTEQHWGGKYFDENSNANEVVFKSNFPFKTVFATLIAIAVSAAIFWPNAKDSSQADEQPDQQFQSSYVSSKTHRSPKEFSAFFVKTEFESFYQPGLEREYWCGTGRGRVNMISVGTEIPAVQRQYFADKGPFLVREFERITGHSPPPTFHYTILFFKSKKEYDEFCINELRYDRDDIPAAVCLPTDDRNFSPILVPSKGTSETTDVLAHEMIHAIAIASYGDLPLCFDEGIADWLGYSYRHRKPNVSNYYSRRDVAGLATMIRSGKFPSLNRYLTCESYDDWDRLFEGNRFIGYQIGGMFLDHLWTHHRRFLHAALAHCQNYPNNIPVRSREFRTYVGLRWPGGWPDLDRRFQNWILDRAKYIWQADK